jgi:hypothetical protein
MAVTGLSPTMKEAGPSINIGAGGRLMTRPGREAEVEQVTRYPDALRMPFGHPADWVTGAWPLPLNCARPASRGGGAETVRR